MMNNLEPHLELEIETQVSLLEEMIWIIQLDPLMTLYCLMGKRLGGLLDQNNQHTCCTCRNYVLS